MNEILDTWTINLVGKLLPTVVPAAVVAGGDKMKIVASTASTATVTFKDVLTNTTVSGDVALTDNGDAVAGRFADPSVPGAYYLVSATYWTKDRIIGSVIHKNPGTNDSGGEWGGNR